MALAEQPLKKRKLHEATRDVPTNLSQNHVYLLSQEDILIRRKHKEEIRVLYDAYRRIRFCLSQTDDRLVSDFEQTYLSLITASRGCSSVQRIVAELIPRYASNCPTALEAAVKVSINMYNWNLATITREEDIDGIAFQTARACVFGLVDICCTASLASPTSSVIGGICSAVFLNVLIFFVSSFEDKDIYNIPDIEIGKLYGTTEYFTHTKQRLVEANESPLLKLFKIRALSLLHIFFSCPKNLLGACFELYDSSTTDSNLQNLGRYFLRQITAQFETDSIDSTTECNNIVTEEKLESENSNTTDKSSLVAKNCVMQMVVFKDKSLRKWIFSRYKKLSNEINSEIKTEILHALEGVCGSFSELDMENGDEGISNEEKPNTSKYINQRLLSQISHRTDKSTEFSVIDSTSKVLDTSNIDVLNFKRGSSEPMQCSSMNENSIHESESLVMKDLEANDHGDSHIEMPALRKGIESKQLTSPSSKRPLDFKSNPMTMSEHHTAIDSQVQHNDFGLTSNLMMSPPKQMKLHSPSNIWYYDGHPASMDIFPACKQLWVGYFGCEATETLVRAHFENFGPISRFFYVPLKYFSVIEYRNIMDAVKAREQMDGSFQWGSCLRVRFLDAGFGCRGFIDGCAVGESCHVFIGKVSSQDIKDDILHLVMKSGVRSPRVVIDLLSQNALLLEFETPEEATKSMLFIRQHREEMGYNPISDKRFELTTTHGKMGSTVSVNYQLLIKQIDISVSDDELINAFSRFGELNGWNFMKQSGCCLVDFCSREAAEAAKCHLDGRRFGPTPIHVEFVGNIHGKLPKNIMGSFLPSSSDSQSGNKSRIFQLSSLLASIFSKHDTNLSATSHESRFFRSFHGNMVKEEDKTPTNTVWVSIPDAKDPFLTDDDLLSICRLAVGDTGSITRLRQVNTQDSFGWFVEFSSTYAATTALKNIRSCPGRFLQIEFRNGGVSFHPDENPLKQRNSGDLGYHPSCSEGHYSLEKLHSIPLLKIEEKFSESAPSVHLNWMVSRSSGLTENNSSDALDKPRTADMVVPGQTISRPNEVHLQMPPTSSMPIPIPPPVSRGPSIIPPPIHMSSFMHPAFISQSNSWDIHNAPPPFPINQISNSIGSNTLHVHPRPPPPFLPSSITPLAHFEQRAPMTTFSSQSPPPLPPDVPPPLPPSPPPLPLSQPPSVPPPPNSPPPQICGETLNLITSGLHRKHQWQGALCKSGVLYCTIYAIREESNLCKYTNAMSEPSEWPTKLDMNKRTDFRHVKATFSSTPMHKREVCCLFPSSMADRKGFQDFISYLKQRECVGVIKIASGKSMWNRLLFILPYSQETCSMLSISPQPTDCLIALLLPRETNLE